MPESHRAQVDRNGNILLPGVAASAHIHAEPIERAMPEEIQTMEEGVWYETIFESERETPQPVAQHQEEFVWESNEPPQSEFSLEKQKTIMEEEELVEEKIQPAWAIEETATRVWSEVRHQLQSSTANAVQESTRQYAATLRDARGLGQEAFSVIKVSTRRFWNFLKQPVWAPGRKLRPVEHSRGVLFMLDTVRFGGTFASIFVVLFAALNYQSFWAIAQSYVDPLAEVTGVGGNDLDKNMAEKLKKIPTLAVAGQSDGNLLDFLPAVGPPDNRLMIPKLKMNVPIVIPPNTALMNEDWKTLEEDIQNGLKDGVVHYPGTARPGQAGNFFVTGHSSYFPWAPGDYKSVFARLGELNVGDEYWVFYNGDRYRYVIQEKKEIKPSDVTALDQPVSKRIGTLMTCTPVGTTLRRLILTAQEVDPVTGLALDVGEHRHEQELPKMKMEMLPI